MANQADSSFSKKEQKKVTEDLNRELVIICNQMKILHDSLVKCMTGGEGGSALWNGADAEKFYKKAQKNIVNNLEDYEKAYGVALIIAAMSISNN